LSIVAYLEGQVDSTNLPAPNPAPPFQAFHDAEDYRRLYPDGRIGADARLTDPSHGPILIDAAVADTVAAFRAMLARHLGS
jgi:creatinine amidohydrolase/Fe(II)-dependent formamide hydrolase-like protein